MWVVLLSVAEAHENGQTGRSVTGCGNCHGGASVATTVSFGALALQVAPNDIVPLTLTIANGAASAGGLDVSGTGGTLAAGSNNQLSGGEITHRAPEPFVGGSVTFDFVWTAPSTNGVFRIRASGNAVNDNGRSSGDAWNQAVDLVITVGSGCADADADGVSDCNGDCDDTDAAIHPGQPERCNGFDDDCDGLTDDPGAVDVSTWFVDDDGDTFGQDVATEDACTAPFGYADRGGDCDDTRSTVHPDAVEACDALDLDEDCSGVADDASAVGALTWYEDADHDGYGGIVSAVACDAPPDTSVSPGDCDDTDRLFHPSAPEADCTDPTDWNCDGSTGFVDADRDGFAACVECADADAARFPGATEVCDALDDDCDGFVDETGATGEIPWFPDGDSDGFGASAGSVDACAPPDGFVGTGDDCDDGEDDVRPDAAETWYDGTDQDCDGNDDDQDRDGVPFPTDCADEDPSTFPGAEDPPYDGVDGNCDGSDDFDADGDGDASDAFGGTDCYDADAERHPGAVDPPCDGVDEDCDFAPDVDPSCPSDTDTADPRGPEPKEGCGCAGAPRSPAVLSLVAALLCLGRRGALRTR